MLQLTLDHPPEPLHVHVALHPQDHAEYPLGDPALQVLALPPHEPLVQPPQHVCAPYHSKRIPLNPPYVSVLILFLIDQTYAPQDPIGTTVTFAGRVIHTCCAAPQISESSV